MFCAGLLLPGLICLVVVIFWPHCPVGTIVVPLINDAATSLDANLVTNRLHCFRYSTMAPIMKDLPQPAAPTIAPSTWEPPSPIELFNQLKAHS